MPANHSIRPIYEDNHLLVVDKPAEIATMGAESGPTMHSLACEYIREKYNKPGKVFVGIVSRLDTMTSGVLVLARTSKSASRLTPQFAGAAPPGKKKSLQRADKIYLAVVEGKVLPEHGELSDYVLKDDRARRMRTVERSAADAKLAQLDYLTIGQVADSTLVAVRLRTGRKHQIRVQFADRGHCVLGDRKYETSRAFGSGIALHSWMLRVDHPTKQERMEFIAPPPKSWERFATALPQQDKLRETVCKRFAIGLENS